MMTVLVEIYDGKDAWHKVAELPDNPDPTLLLSAVRELAQAYVAERKMAKE